MKIKIYSTPTCPYCKAAKTFLKKEKIDFEDIDVSIDKKALEEMKEKTGGEIGVPVIDVDGEIMIGFDEEKLSKLIK